MSLLTVKQMCEKEREERSRRAANAFYLASQMAAAKGREGRSRPWRGAPFEYANGLRGLWQAGVSSREQEEPVR